jgi:Holliday junction resolvase-like predicted endonuclease
VSLIERGHVRSVLILECVLAALDAQLVLEVRWRAGALDRLLDEDHAALVAAVVTWLTEAGWDVRVEVTYSQFGERGSFDVLAIRDGVVLVVEVKTDIASAEGTLRKLDEKARLALLVARERFGWQGRQVRHARSR